MSTTANRSRHAVCVSILLLFISSITIAEGQSEVSGKLKKDVRNAMKNYIATQTFDNKLYVFDAVQNKLLKLTFDKLHPRVIEDGNFYISCADFTDQDGRTVDLDFMVRASTDKDKIKYITTQSIVHAISGEYRPYHVGDRGE